MGHERLPEDSAARKRIPLCEGVIDYFDSALVGVACVGPIPFVNHAHAIVIHLMQRGRGSHSALLCKHALQLLQLEITGSCGHHVFGLGELFDVYHDAFVAIAEVSLIGSEKHRPGKPLCHQRGLSMDHSDCIMRHRAQRGTLDTSGKRHSAYMAWRCFALYQQELEAQGAAMARNAC